MMTVHEEGMGQPSGVYPILNAHAVALAEIKRDLHTLTKDVGQMNRYLITGNGGDSLMTRVALVEQQVATAAVALKDLLHVWESARVTEQGGKWKLIVAVVGGLMGLVGAVVTAVLGLHHP